MARFIGTAQGERGEASRLGHHGMTTTCRGWNLGVRVEAQKRWDDGVDVDQFCVSINEGSGRTNADYGGFYVRTMGERVTVVPNEEFLRRIPRLLLSATLVSAFGDVDAYWADFAERLAENPVAVRHIKAALFIEGHLSE